MKNFLKIACLVLLIAELLLLEKLRIETPMTTVSRVKTAGETVQTYTPSGQNPNLITYTPVSYTHLTLPTILRV